MTELSIRILGRNMPSDWCRAHGLSQVGVGHRRDVIDATSTQEPGAEFQVTVDVVRGADGELDFRGPYVQGRKGERFLYLTWSGDSGAVGGRAKLQLLTIDKSLVETAMAGSGLVADVDLTNGKGGPAVATLREPTLRWRVG
ncbi:MAG TPA: DUF5990 family protein [Actinopolymorphaceae bacterium]|jgi:hypothetical protein|nr:DUF5990 family protein [Actinopolymorphaceae bacterium]